MSFPNFQTILKKHPALRLFIVFGSQGLKQAAPTSDWDLAFIADPGLDLGALYTDLILLLGTDGIDVVNLETANALHRFIAAQSSVPIFEKSSGEHEKFWFEAVNFWCDSGPLIKKEYHALLNTLDRSLQKLRG